MTLVLVGCLSLARVIPPPPNRGALMHLNGFEDLEQLVASPNLASFNELVEKIAGTHMCVESKRFVPNCEGPARQCFTRLSADSRVLKCQIY